MKRKLLQSNLIILSLMLFCLTCFDTFGQRKKISMQGFLKDANGKAIDDGPQSLTFKIYTVASGGTAIWTEDQSIRVFGGVYSAQLGSVTDIAALAWDVPYFVGVTVQGTELSPRTELTYAPYSFGTNKAQEVVCSGAVGDVKYSVLNPTQFAIVNGACWVPMDGGSMIGSKLAGLIGGSTVPNAGGLFLRGQESANGTTNNDPDRDFSSAIAQLQDQSFLNHDHNYSSQVTVSGTTSSGGDHNMVFANQKFIGDGGGTYALTPYNTNGEIHTKSIPTHQHSFSGTGTAAGTTVTKGGNETRPKNLNLWTYIRIN